MLKHTGMSSVAASWTWWTPIGLYALVLRIFGRHERKATCGECVTEAKPPARREVSVATKEQRRHVRHAVKLPATFANERASGYAIIENVSHGGCKITTRLVVARGDSGRLLINLPGCHAPVTVSTALVRWVKGDQCGIEFMGIDPHDLGLLDQATTRLGAHSLSAAGIAIN